MCSDDECFCCSKKTQGRIVVSLVTLLISFCFISYWSLIILSWKWLYSLKGWINIIFLHVHFSLLCYSYYKTIVTNPGTVPKDWTPQASEELKKLAIEKEEKRGRKIVYITEFYNPRYCHHCKSFKPERSHHCKDCKTCVLKMDHHCPWVNNCVGIYNHKYFILFLYYATVSLTYFLVCCGIKFYYTVKLLPRSAAYPHVIVDFALLLIHAVLTLPVTLGIASLLVYQLNNLKKNLTSIEHYLDKYYQSAARRAKIKPWVWFYDWGAMNNYKQVMGPTILDWFIPNIPKHLHQDYVWKGREYNFVEEKYVLDQQYKIVNPNKNKTE